jgi:hypothetical protein
MMSLPFQDRIQHGIDKGCSIFYKCFTFRNAVGLLLIVLLILLLPCFYIKTELFFQQLPRFFYMTGESSSSTSRGILP